MPAPWTAHAQGRIHGEIHGQQTVNVMNFATNSSLGGGADVALLVALAAAIMQCVETVLLPAVTQDWTCTSVSTQYIGTVLPSATTDPHVLGPTGSGQGQLGVTSVSFAATLIHLNSGTGKRNGRGRLFLPPPGEAQVASSRIDDPTLTLMVAFLNCLLGKFVGPSHTEQFELGVWSRKLQGGPSFTGFDNAFFPVKTLDVANTLAVIGRRKVGRGD